MHKPIWQAFEFTLSTSKQYANPFLDVDVIATFRGPDGRNITRLAFWDGDGVWRVRAALTAVGAWRCEISSTDPDNADFSGTWELECAPCEGDLAIYRHGFLRVGPQGRYLIHDDGTPFFWLGDTHWTFVTEERWDESNCPRYESQFRACVDRRVQQKFTVYQSNFRDGRDFNMFGRYDEYLIEGAHGLIPDVEFLRRNVDPKMKYIADAGLVNAVGYSWGPAILSEGGVTRYRLLAKYLVARYGAYPVVWTLAGELPGYFPDARREIADSWREVALETAKWDSYGNLISAHQAAGLPFTDIYQGESWYGLAMTQAAHGDFEIWGGNYSAYREKFPRCPVVESEGLYEGVDSNEAMSRVITDKMLRSLAYSAIQNGCCGYTYGANGVWELQWEAGVGGIGWGDMAWWDGLALPGAEQLTYMREMYESVGWHRLRPIQHLVDQSIFLPALKKRDEAYFTADDEMTTVVGYFPPTAMKRCTIHGLAARSYTARWFDPETGAYSLITESARPAGGAWSLPRPDARGFREKRDAVLILTANS